MSVIRLFIGGAAISALVGYFSAFNVVGVNFLLPGRYSYAILCVFMLCILTAVALVQINKLKVVDFIVVLSGAITSLLVPLLVFHRASTLIEGYFIGGLLPGVVITCCLLAWSIWNKKESIFRLSDIRFYRLLALYASVLIIYGLACSVGADSEYLRFLRQQLYLLPFVGVLTGCILTFCCLKRAE